MRYPPQHDPPCSTCLPCGLTVDGYTVPDHNCAAVLREKVTALNRVLVASLDEHGWSCSCGEAQFRGEPCVQCRMRLLLGSVLPMGSMASYEVTE